MPNHLLTLPQLTSHNNKKGKHGHRHRQQSSVLPQNPPSAAQNSTQFNFKPQSPFPSPSQLHPLHPPPISIAIANPELKASIIAVSHHARARERGTNTRETHHHETGTPTGAIPIHHHPLSQLPLASLPLHPPLTRSLPPCSRRLPAPQISPAGRPEP